MFQVHAQKFGAGVSLMYNFQTESFAPSFRAEFVKGEFSIVPQFSYYPAFNPINEFYLGVSAHQNILGYGDWNLYGIANLSYNGWINHASSSMQKAKFSNMGAELGAGLKKGKCLQPFLELRYNFKWKEANLGLGLVYFINCGKKKRGNKVMSCPAYSN